LHFVYLFVCFVLNFFALCRDYDDDDDDDNDGDDDSDDDDDDEEDDRVNDNKRAYAE